MDLTDSFERLMPDVLLDRYSFAEVRNATAVLAASNPEPCTDVVDVLDEFYFYDSDILTPGGNRGPIPIRLDQLFEDRGWRAVRVNTEVRLVGKMKSTFKKRNYDGPEFLNSEVHNDGFEVDNMKGRVALDVEWNAKDGNLDRDLSAYRALYDVGLIDVAVMITRDYHGILELARGDLGDEDAYRRLKSTTTTNIQKLTPRLTRGDAGGCPVLAVAISRDTWDGR